MTHLDRLVADAILGIDTLWGGDVMNPSGTGRFVADSWFSDAPLPAAYHHPSAARMRRDGGITAATFEPSALEDYLAVVDVPAAIAGIRDAAVAVGGLRGRYLEGLAACFRVMWDLAMEIAGRGDPVPYERCIETLTGKPPEPSDPSDKLALLEELLGRGLLGAAVSRWREDRRVPSRAIPEAGGALISKLDALAAANLAPFLPPELDGVPRANVRFLPIDNAFFSGSMNYLGRARQPDGSPEYEATYEINAALEISAGEFEQLVSHEVVPGHVTTFAFLQRLYTLGKVGFEASVLTMNSRAAVLAEGIANNAILIAHGVTEVHQLPDPDLQIGATLALLQDDAKNQASYLTWREGLPEEEVAGVLRRDYLVSNERARKLAGPWARHPLLGRMSLPAYRAGTQLVASLRRRLPPERILPALYGCDGLVDGVTIAVAVDAR